MSSVWIVEWRFTDSQECSWNFAYARPFATREEAESKMPPRHGIEYRIAEYRRVEEKP